MLRASCRIAVALMVSCALQSAPRDTHAQTASPAMAESPRIDKVEFAGADNISASALRDSIETQSTRCRGLLLKPLCAVSQSSYFVDTHHLDRAEIPRDELRIRVIYFRAGFRHATVSTTITPDGDDVDVTFNIVEGPPTTISALTIVQTDTVLSNRQIRQSLMPGTGHLLSLVKIDSAKIRLRGMLWDLGYGDAIVEDTMRIDGATHTATLHIGIDPVHHTTIDTVIVAGNEGVSTNTIRRLLGLREGDPYRRLDMTAAQRRLYETEFFRQTLVQVPEETDSAKTVNITVREAPFTALRTGIGFNTTEFGQAEVRLTRYNWFGGARRLDARAVAGNFLAKQFYGKSIFGGAAPLGIEGDVDDRFLTPTWEIGATLSEPFVLDARASLGFGVSTHRRSIPGIVIDRGFSANTSFTWRFFNFINGSAIYQFEKNRVEAGDLYFCINFGVCGLNTIAALRSAQRLSPFTLRGLAERADDPLAPTRGFTAQLELEHASRFTASDFRYNRISADFAKYFPRGRSVIALHGRAGWVRPSASTGAAVGVDVDDNSILHPRKRFYAGGARSVRGFGENQLGPRVLTIDPLQLMDTANATPCTIASISDATCDPNDVASKSFVPRPLGGNTLIEASIEYRFPLTRTMRGAVFVDAGSVRGQRLNLPPANKTAITPGFGIRYNSPIGPVRLDLGIRPGLEEDLPVVTQLPDSANTFRLIQLNTSKRYDPLDGSGFLHRLTSRLQLHLAIGEAW